jgi:homoserine O-acetyltransferase
MQVKSSRPQESAIEVKYLKRGKLLVLETIWGHAAGSGASKEDAELIDRVIADFLTRTQ